MDSKGTLALNQHIYGSQLIADMDCCRYSLTSIHKSEIMFFQIEVQSPWSWIQPFSREKTHFSIRKWANERPKGRPLTCHINPYHRCSSFCVYINPDLHSFGFRKPHVCWQSSIYSHWNPKFVDFAHRIQINCCSLFIQLTYIHIYIYTYVCYCMLPNYQQWNIRSTGSAVGLADHTACRPRESKPGWLQMTSYIVDDSCWENNERFVWVHRHLHLQLGFINIMCIYMHIGDFDLIDIGCNYKNKNSQNKRTYIISWYNIIFYTCTNQRKWATSLCLVQGFCVQSLEPATETAGAQCPAISAME